ncbi:MAG TPA: molybdopterin-dependent oxidoreductase [Gemmataceae bacterium]
MSEAPKPGRDGDAEVRRQSRRHTRRSFLTGGLVAAAGAAGWYWLRQASLEDGIPWPARRVLQFNERLTGALFSDKRLASTYDRSRAAEDPRVNGGIGLRTEVDPTAWRLQVEDAGGRNLSLSLDDIKKLPRTEMVTQLRCIEGWAEIIHWGGVPLADFAAHYRFGTRSGNAPDPHRNSADWWSYVSLATPDERYYVGLDIASVLHPQTLLCWEINGQPLSSEHGAPLRLVIPVKYGVKNIKRIGTIRFQDERPADYWAERGYDWYAGL